LVNIKYSSVQSGETDIVLSLTSSVNWATRRYYSKPYKVTHEKLPLNYSN